MFKEEIKAATLTSSLTTLGALAMRRRYTCKAHFQPYIPPRIPPLFQRPLLLRLLRFAVFTDLLTSIGNPCLFFKQIVQIYFAY